MYKKKYSNSSIFKHYTIKASTGILLISFQKDPTKILENCIKLLKCSQIYRFYAAHANRKTNGTN